ncbi:uncharacterized protein LOC111373966 [Olea europaea var. sylvestris]|uniref:Uncharacterized protein n=1 Tax=Olea europaea subsp. europaea TaxID=158383 RepID=A0A8S0QVB1_OLEEU|nr:uncharacterized protein LOC111373966 [Olea europaea var. sylvestris]CAA2969959.1 Hypothetical predicted protein [Olea europaea subsp. europaea]
MEHFRSKSCNGGRMQMQSYNKANSNMQDFRCYGIASYKSSPSGPNKTRMNNNIAAKDQWKFKKGKSTNGSVSKNWGFGDLELQRKKRVASYKVYTVEEKVKESIKKSFRWIKERVNKYIGQNLQYNYSGTFLDIESQTLQKV